MSTRALRKNSVFLLCVLLLSTAVSFLGGCGENGIPAAYIDGSRLVSMTSGGYFETYRERQWNRHLIKGFDIGTSIPNHWPGQLAISKETYSRWLEQIAETNANTILVYTLLMPWFYEALHEFNSSNPDNELLLVQQIWPRENEEEFDLYDSERAQEFRHGITYTVDALAGDASIPVREGEAWGDYGVNVLPYTLGVLVGREILTQEVIDTNANHPDKVSFDGKYVRTAPSVTPMEAWYAEMMELAAGRLDHHGWTAPVGFASWPTLDPLNHPTELTPGGDKSREVDDSQVIDPNNLEPGSDNVAGIFGTYQIYPYYPEFIYREPEYAQYQDDEGTLRFGGYIREFMSVHPDYPAVVGEVGLSTSLGIAHQHPEGLTHGGISERQQGEGLTRMINAIVREGYAGQFIFEWQDEWAKKNWVTYPYMIPYARHVHWHNMMDPEQNFGVLAMEPDHVPFDGKSLIWEGTGGTAIYMDQDAAFLYVEVKLDEQLLDSLRPGDGSEIEMLLGIDTIGPDHGTTGLPVVGLPELPTGVEFLFRASSGSARLQARPDYNKSTSRFMAAPSQDPVFEDVVYLTNRAQVSQEDGTYFPAIPTNESLLNYGTFMTDSPEYDSNSHWYVDSEEGSVRIRLPWTQINVSDPSSHTVILDPRYNLPPGPAYIQETSLFRLRTAITDGFHVYVVITEQGEPRELLPGNADGFDADTRAFIWKGWEEASYRSRLKQSYQAVVDLYRDLESLVP